MKRILAWVAVVALTASAKAVTISMVTVGNVGNPNDSNDGDIYSSGVQNFGAVPYMFNMGKYEITAGQYTEFLNAVAKDDPNQLYNLNMGDPNDGPSGHSGANIQRTGSAPNFNYGVAPDWANRPVNWVSLWDAARFANWLHNGKSNGAQGPGTTESGAYHDIGNVTLFGRSPGAKFFIPTENEWYKAAYHKNDGVTGNYWEYPTRSNTEPVNSLPDPGNHANYRYGATFGYVIGPPYYRTEVGEFVNSPSPYGTYDQGGNVWEWNQTRNFSDFIVRGSALDDFGAYMRVEYRNQHLPETEAYFIGFRVASAIPEPATLILALGIFAPLAAYRRRESVRHYRV